MVPILSKAYVQALTADYTHNSFTRMMEEVKQKNFKRLAINHHLLSGFKALFTEEAWYTVDVCRRACGGAGFSAQAGFSDIMDITAPNATWEGENSVMALQSAKLLLKMYQMTPTMEKEFSYPFSYLNHVDKLVKLQGVLATLDDFTDADKIQQALAVRSAIKI